MAEKENWKIPYNKPLLLGTEKKALEECLAAGVFSGDNKFTRECHQSFKNLYQFNPSFLSHSCSIALEMAAHLCHLEEDDEIILPSFAYLTDASAFARTGAKLVFADSEKDRPHISSQSIAEKITAKTKVLLIVHYAGIACDMDAIMELVNQHHLILIEDCAHAIHAKYKNQFLGSFGQMSTFSFHETKNIHCGEGGLLVINNPELEQEALEMWNEGSNRAAFQAGKVSSYEWTSLGSSYQTSELNAAFLWAQLQAVNQIIEKRKKQWEYYQTQLQGLSDHIHLPILNDEGYNAHIFYLKLASKKERTELQQFLAANGILAPFHYQALHLSPYWLSQSPKLSLPYAEAWSDCLLRLPLFDSMTIQEQDFILAKLFQFFQA